MMCHVCGEQEILAENMCVDCLHYSEVDEMHKVIDDPGVRCDCEDYPCCGH